jgi:endonuclease/exonuclease/phosphatase family metal-dependent hydrolase
MRLAPLTALTAALVGGFSPVAHAFDVEEFDAGFGEWEFSPQKIGRSTTDGWVRVADGTDTAAMPSPSLTSSTYYWTLSRPLDLTAAADPLLDLKLEFLAGGYDWAAVQIGPEGSTRLSDYTSLVQYTTATGGAQESLIDLAPYRGQRWTLRVILRKPYGVVASTPGLRVHRAGVVLQSEINPPPPEPEILSLGAFNVQVFGLTKMARVGVPESLTAIANRYDLLLIQEIRDKSGTAIVDLLNRVNAATDDDFAMVVSNRLGRTTSKEQYAFFYRASKLTLLDTWHFDEMGNDVYEREPWVGLFETMDGKDFAVVGLHAAPEAAEEEISHLDVVLADVRARFDESDILLMGDLNAGCTYLSPEELRGLSVYTDPLLSWWVGDAVDTTTTSTVCPYDRIVTSGLVTDLTVEGSGGVFLFDQALQLSPTDTRAVSDHYPVELLIDINRID